VGEALHLDDGCSPKNGLPESRTPSVAQPRGAGAFRRHGTSDRWTWTRWTQWTRWTTGWAKRCGDGRMPDEARASGVTHACRSAATEPSACGRRRRVRTLARRPHQRPPSTRRPPPLGPQGPLGPQATPVCAPRRSARRPPAPCPKPRETPEAPAPEPSACDRRRRVGSHARLPSHRLARRPPSVVMGLRVGGRGPGGPSGPGGQLGRRSAAVTGGCLTKHGLPESRTPAEARHPNPAPAIAPRRPKELSGIPDTAPAIPGSMER